MSTTASKLLESNIQVFLEVQNAFDECDPEIQSVIREMMEIHRSPDASEQERRLAMHTIVDALFPSSGVDVADRERVAASSANAMAREAEMDEQEAAFADKVRQLMQEQGKSQIELGEQMGVSQSAISNMLSRKCRPQRRTIDRAAEALGVPPTDLWPSYCSDDDSE
ncbi:helix-turn-helix domain-containing protein [Posidoniimonas corsicana]|nr:helix-turn-helix transcriptional regulator [Posidoniimonas corsicana]